MCRAIVDDIALFVGQNEQSDDITMVALRSGAGTLEWWSHSGGEPLPIAGGIMDIRESRRKDIIILAVHGKLDAATSPVFDQKLLPMLERGEKNFLIDFSHMDYISSAALRRLLLLAKRAEASGGKVVFASLQDPVREIFDIAGFSKIFSICSSQEEAVAFF